MTSANLGFLIIIISNGFLWTIICAYETVRGEEKVWITILLITILFVTFGITSGIGLDIVTSSSERMVREDIAKEVNMTKVPIEGKITFTAKVKISYKNGKLETVELIKNSTDPI